MVLQVQSLGLQSYLFACLLLESRKAARLLIEKQVDNSLMREDEGRIELELSRLPNNLSENLKTDRLGGYHKAAAGTARTILA